MRKEREPVGNPTSSFALVLALLIMLWNRKFLHPARAEPNTKHRELRGRKIGYFIMNGAAQENGKPILKSPTPWRCVGYRLYRTRSPAPRVRGFKVVLGAKCSEEIKGNKSFFWVLRTVLSLSPRPSAWFHGKEAAGGGGWGRGAFPS